MSRISTRRLVYQSLIAALIALCTAFIKLPVSITNGYVHLGDGAIFLAAALLGPSGCAAAAIGSALADTLFGYYVYIIPTFLIKGAMGLIAGLMLGKRPRVNVCATCVYALCELVMVAGYFLFETCLYGIGAAAGAVVPNLIQGVAGVVVGCVLVKIADKLPSAD